MDGKCVGLLATVLNVEPLLQMKVTGLPMTADQDPAILVHITSRRDQRSKGVIRFKEVNSIPKRNTGQDKEAS